MVLAGGTSAFSGAGFIQCSAQGPAQVEAQPRAIGVIPRHRGAHEYIGETYLAVGDLANAQKHLAALRDICVLPCEELADLEKAVAQYQAKR